MISVIIPYMESYPEKRKMLHDTIHSFTGGDEVIVVSNWREGYAKPINKGLAVARGDFLIVMNDDLDFHGANLEDLCDETAVTSPKVNGKVQDFWGCSFCIPRWVYEKIGGMDERYRISYFDDDDFWFTLIKEEIPHRCVESVEVSTEGGATLDNLPDRDSFFSENLAAFINKWGDTPEEMHRKRNNE